MDSIKSSDTILKFYFSHLGQLKGGILLTLCRVLVVAPIPWIFKIIIDHNVPSADSAGIIMLVMIAVGLLLLHYAIGVAGVKQIALVTMSIAKDMRASLFNQMQFLSYSYLDQNPSGKLVAKYTIDTQKIQDTLLVLSERVIPDMFYGLVIFAVLVSLDWKLSVVLIFLIPIYFLSRVVFSNQLKASHEKIKVTQEGHTSTVSELILALRYLKTLGSQKSSRERLKQDNSDLALAYREMLAMNIAFWTTMYVLAQILALTVVGGGAYLVVEGGMSMGTLVAYLAALPILLLPIDTLTAFADTYYRGEVSYQSIRELANNDFTESHRGSKCYPNLEGDIKFEDVDFCYPSKPDKKILSRFNLHIKAGENIALVGESGSGKSTVASLILGLYEVTSGELKIDGGKLSELSLNWFRQQCAMVMQDTILLSGSIIENIRFAKEDATDEDVFRAARMANAEEFILKLPGGYDSIIGERGVGLSGGQRQRLSIARALLRDPTILILDEATSALDKKSEDLVRQALETVSRGRTVITIAHRLNTIRNADRVVVLSGGVIIEQGGFDHLLESNSYLKRMIDTRAEEKAALSVEG